VEEPRRAEWGNPLSWRVADRCLAIAILMMASNTLVFVSTITGGWPLLPFPARDAPALPIGELLVTLVWGVVALVSRRARSRDGASTGLAIMTVWWYGSTIATFTLVTGPFAPAGWIGMVGGAVVGYVLFPRWLALAGIGWYAVLVIGMSVVLGRHGWPLLDPLFPPAIFVGLDGREIARQAINALALGALTFAVIAWVVDRWRDREDRYLQLASTDSLTGLTNRRRFLEIAERELARSRRYGSALALVLVDLDHFKAVNDRFGHLAGDQVLIAAAQALARGLRTVDVIARHGGEEFAILLPETDAAGAREVAERASRLLASTEIPVETGPSVTITASMGVASARGPEPLSLDELLRRADAALYAAKRAGRDRVEVAPAA
jgi:diguanylate cyclase (GGDEF)-like protein